MKILVFSDSHGDVNSMIYITEDESPDMVIHLGDNYSDALRLSGIFPDIRFENVVGNCDFEEAPSRKTFKLENFTFFITHGNKYGVKKGINKILKKGASEKADVILFGHTHISQIENKDGVWAINPGSISRTYTRDSRPTFARILIENEKFSCEIIQS